MIPRSNGRVQAIEANSESVWRKKEQSDGLIPMEEANNGSSSLIPSPIKGNWQKQLAQAVTQPEELCALLNLDQQWLSGAQSGHELFPIRVPHAYLNRIERGNPNDPLLRQVIPLSAESNVVEGFISDPLEEAEHRPCQGLIHKYHNRVLLITSGACAVNCRYCFRRHFPYGENTLSTQALDRIIAYLEQHPEITEVILSGGDPLASSDKRLANMIERLERIPHLIRLRIHTRLPVVIPDRVDAALQQWLANTRLQTVVVLHINHPNEISDDVTQACQRLLSTGATLLNQSVLLRGINDDADILKALSEKLFASRILPYYLHVLDPVSGAAHFDVPDEEAVAIVASLRKNLSGFLMPRLVREIPGELSKTPLPQLP